MNFNEKKEYLRQHEKDFGFEESELDYLLFETNSKSLSVDSIKENVKSDIKINCSVKRIMEDNNMKKTKIINFIAGAGSGKSTMCAGVFSKLKMNGVDCELSSEYAKELVWESRNETFKDEVYIFAKQNHRLFRLNGKVDVVITDRPLIMSNIYNQYYNPDRKEFNKIFEDFVKANWNMYDNVNIFINRVKQYNPNGRNETLEQALELDTLFKNYLDTNKIDYICVNGNEKGLDDAVNYIIGVLDKQKAVDLDKEIKDIKNEVKNSNLINKNTNDVFDMNYKKNYNKGKEV